MRNSAPTMNKKHGFTLMEVIGSIVVLTFLISSFSVAIRGAFELERVFEAENRGIVVLNNVVERLAANEIRYENKAREILMEEYSMSDLADTSIYSPHCYKTEEKIWLEIRKQNGASLVKIEFSK